MSGGILEHRCAITGGNLLLRDGFDLESAVKSDAGNSVDPLTYKALRHRRIELPAKSLLGNLAFREVCIKSHLDSVFDVNARILVGLFFKVNSPTVCKLISDAYI